MEYLTLSVLIAAAWSLSVGILAVGMASIVAAQKRFPRKDAGALALLAAATLLVFAPVLVGRAWRPGYGGDLLGFLYPTYSFAARSLSQGQVPLWNPYLYSGAPWAFDVQSGLFYPPNLLAFLFQPDLSFRMMEFLVIFHFFLTGAMTYVCLRLLPWGPAPLGHISSGIGAMAFAFSDFFVIHFGNLNLVAAASWIPLFFIGTVLSVSRGSWRWGLVGGVALALSILAGHPQPVIYAIALWGFYLVFAAFQQLRSRRRRLARLAIALLPPAVGLGLSALFLLPALEMIQYTIRAALSYEEASAFSLAPTQLWGLLLPGVFGRGPETFWSLGEWQRVEVGYLGVLTLGLALWGLFRVPSAGVRFLGGVAAAALLMALGSHLPIHRWLYELVPAFDQMRVPARWILLLDFALAGLAAYGFEHLTSRVSEPRYRRGLQGLLIGVGALALVGAVGILSVGGPRVDETRRAQVLSSAALSAVSLGGAFLWTLSFRWAPSRPRRRSLLLGGLLFLEVGWAAAPVELGWEDPSTAFDHPDAVSYLKDESSLFRIDTPLEVWYLWQPDLALLHGLFELGGIWNPLTLGDYHAYYWGLENRSNPLYDFLNARFLIVPKGAPPPDAERWRLAFTSDPTVDLYENERAYPRFFVVHRARSVPSHDAAWAELHQAGFDPQTTVILQGEWPSGQKDAGADVRLLEYGLNLLRLEVRSEAPGYLVASEVFYPGWKAWVNGQPTELLRANYAFRAVPVPTGKSEVRMEFHPSSWPIGLAFSLLTATVLVVALLAAELRGGRRRQGHRRASDPITGPPSAPGSAA